MLNNGTGLEGEVLGMIINFDFTSNAIAILSTIRLNNNVASVPSSLRTTVS